MWDVPIGVQAELPAKTLTKRRLLEAFFALCHEICEPVVVFLRDGGHAITDADGALSALEVHCTPLHPAPLPPRVCLFDLSLVCTCMDGQVEMERDSSRVLFLLSTVDDLSVRPLRLPNTNTDTHTPSPTHGERHDASHESEEHTNTPHHSSTEGGEGSHVHPDSHLQGSTAQYAPSATTMSVTLPSPILNLMMQLGEALAKVCVCLCMQCMYVCIDNPPHCRRTYVSFTLYFATTTRDPTQHVTMRTQPTPCAVQLDEDGIDDIMSQLNDGETDDEDAHTDADAGSESDDESDADHTAQHQTTPSPLLWAKELHKAFGDEKLVCIRVCD